MNQLDQESWLAKCALQLQGVDIISLSGGLPSLVPTRKTVPSGQPGPQWTSQNIEFYISSISACRLILLALYNASLHYSTFPHRTSVNTFQSITYWPQNHSRSCLWLRIRKPSSLTFRPQSKLMRDTTTSCHASQRAPTSVPSAPRRARYLARAALLSNCTGQIGGR